MTTLLHKPLLIPEESPGSVIIRTCERNGYLRVSHFLTDLGFRGDLHSQLKSWFIQHSRWEAFIHKINALELASVGYRKTKNYSRSPVKFNGHVLKASLLRLKRPAICPDCIEENGYLKWAWDYKLITACEKHQRMLINRCESCDTPVKWYRSKLNYCSCGYNYLESSSNRSTGEYSRYIQQLLLDNKHIKLTKIENCYEALTILCGNSKTMVEQNIIIAHAVKLASNKPSKKAIKWLSEIVLQRAKLGIHPRVTMLPLLAIQDKAIQANTKQCLDIIQTRIDSEFIAPIKLTDIITNKNAATALGVSVFVVKSLVRTKSISAPNKFEVHLNSLNNLLWHFSQSNCKSDDKLYPVSDFISKPSFGLGLKDIVQLIQSQRMRMTPMMLSQGVLSTFVTEPNRSIEKPEGTISLLEVCEQYHAPYEAMRKLAKLEIIKAAKNSKNQNSHQFDKGEVQQFFSDYIFSTQIARELGVSGQSVTAILKRKKINPISGPHIDEGITNLYRKSEIKHIHWSLFFTNNK